MSTLIWTNQRLIEIQILMEIYPILRVVDPSYYNKGTL
jgi:hypothetical protein